MGRILTSPHLPLPPCARAHTRIHLARSAPLQADGTGGVYVFEQPANPLTDAWVRHDLSVGFRPIHYHLPGAGGPGTARTFHADTRDTVRTPRPHTLPPHFFQT